MTKLHLIYAQAANRVIGKNNQLPWHLPSDLIHFKKTTLGHPVIMGRKTWDSLPAKFRPLPGRLNLVLTQNADWSSQGALKVHSLKEALENCKAFEHAWVIGGAQLYALALPLASSIVVTQLHQPFDGDAYAPELGKEWIISKKEAGLPDSPIAHEFITYIRADASALK